MKTIPHVRLEWKGLILRSCDKHLCTAKSESDTTTLEIMDVDSRCTIAYWEADSEGYDLQFVGPRPFQMTNAIDFWFVAKFGQSILDAESAKWDK